MLPKLNEPVFDIDVPSIGKKVKFRPFKVKEEKILLLAQQDGAPEQMINGVVQIISNCIVDEIDVSKLPYFDIEYIFIKLRVAALGNTIEYKYTPSGGDTPFEARVDFDDVVVKGDIKSKPGKIKLTDNTAVILKYPSIGDIASMNVEDEHAYTDVARVCIKSIVVDEDIFEFQQYSLEEQREWIDSLTGSQYKQFASFFQNLPSVVVESKYKDAEGEIHVNELKGLRNFF